MRIQPIAILALLLCGGTFADVELIRNGEPVSEIVIAVDAVQGVKLAAEDLQKHVELMSGAKLSIVNAPSPNVKNQVYIGASRFTEDLGFKPAEFGCSGLEILVKENYIILDGPNKHWKQSPYGMNYIDVRYLGGSVITGESPPKPDEFPSPGLKAWQEFCGEKFTTIHLNTAAADFNEPLKIYTNDDPGPWYAVAELLEQLGVRWYMPYEFGTVIPDKKTVTVADQHLRKEAAFGRREWCYYGTRRQDGEGIAWLKRLKAGNYHIILYNHTTYAIYSSYEQQQLHPEYLACDAEGKPYLGYPSGRGMPRYTDPGFRAAAVTYMNKVLESQPDLWAVTVGPPDGGVKMDARDIPLYGKPDDSVEQKASNYVWDFHVFLCNELKRSHPDKYLIYCTGAGAREIPTNIEEFPDNLLVPGSFSPGSYWVLDSQRRAQLDAYGKWVEKMQVVRRAPTWDHWLSYRTPTHPRYPVVFTRALQDQMNRIQPYIDGKFIEIQPARQSEGRTEGVPNRLGVPGLTHLMVYWQNRLFWDPNADREAMLDEYYKLFFGPAEAEMREFYEFAEEAWSRQESRSLTESTGFLQEADVDRYFEILARARAKAGEGTLYDRRIALIESEMASLKKLFPNLKRTGPWIRAYPAPRELAIDGDLSEYKYGWTTLRESVTGETPAKNATRVVLTMGPNKSLIVGAICHENRMDEIKADCTVNDDFSIFEDDAVEIYVNTPERSYFKIVVNPNGAIWTETTDVAIIDRDTLPILWNPELQVAVKKFDDRWTVEVMIPSDDFGKMGPSRTYPWGIQVGRSRFTGGHTKAWEIAPTSGGPYRATNRWGNLWMR